MKRAPISAYLGFVLVYGVATTVAAQTKTSHQPVRRVASAERAITSSEVHIAPTTLPANSTSIDVGGDHWIARGYDLKTLISQIYDIDVRRVDLVEDYSGDARFDVTLTLPREVDEDVMQRMLENALEQRFGLTITPESRAMDVYVLTAPNGPGAALHRHGASGAATLVAADSTNEATGDTEQIMFLGKNCDGVSSGGISASAGTLGEFRRTLEPDLDRLLIDETGLKGSYDFQIGNYGNENELFKLLHDQLGILVTPEQRNITVLTVRPKQELQAAL
ncbi:MAG: TIGR03435 family protein [Acidobacteriaceae bacterium]|jgi:uncharacterized protein (TIGR03435 family)